MDNRDSKDIVALKQEDLIKYGGQAVVEGVMMRSPRYFAVACRKPDGSIIVQREHVDTSILGKLKWLNKPFLRGTLAILDAMILGSRALSFASKVQMDGEVEKLQPKSDEAPHAHAHAATNGKHHAPPTEAASDTKPSSNRISDIAIGGTIVVSLLFGLAIFRVLPTILTDIFEKRGLFPTSTAYYWKNAADGGIRAVFFFTYILLISRMPGIKAVFEYHGAEHKAINTLEAGEPLNNQYALQASRIHPRCGTSFIIVVMVVDFLTCLFLPRPSLIFRIGLHLCVLPIVAGIAFEVIKFAGKFRHNRWIMAAFAPGMWTQRLTTREPRADQVDVALVALYSVLEAEGHAVPTIANVVDTSPKPIAVRS